MMGYCKKEGCREVFKKETKHCRVCEKCKRKAYDKLIVTNKNRVVIRQHNCAVKKDGYFYRFVSGETPAQVRLKIKESGLKRMGAVFYA